MVMIVAIINNNVVTEVKDISDDAYADLASKNQLVIDITTSNPTPVVGWLLQGNTLVGDSQSMPKINKWFNVSIVLDPRLSPISLDYVTSLDIKLHRKSILVKGECRAEEFYENYNGVTYSNLIVKEVHTFTRDALGFATKRDTTITWYNNDEQPNQLQKFLPKYYSSVEQIEEGKTRRGNLVNALQIPTIGLISIAMIGSTNATMAVILEGRKFLAEYKLEFDVFVNESNKAMLDCFTNPSNPRYVSADKYSWIDFMTPYGVTIRNYLYNEMNI
jgi:hypothetical protein